MGKRNNLQTPAEQESKEKIDTELAAGGDPFGDDEEIVHEGVDAAAARAKAEQDEANGITAEAESEAEADPKEAPADDPKADPKADPKKEGEAEEAPAEEEAADAIDDELPDENEPRPYRGPDLKDAATTRADLLKQKATALKELMDGTLEADAYSAKEAEISTKLDELNRNQAIADAKAQDVTDYQQAVLTALQRTAKAQGVDYTDKKVAKQFDVALTVLMADPDNASRSFKALAKDAHSAIMAVRGISKAATKTAKVEDKTPPARVPPKAPLTLRGIPAANVPNTTGGGVKEAMAHLKGPDFQDAYGKLSPAAKAKLLDE